MMVAEQTIPQHQQKLLLVSAAALIDTQGRILLTQRPEGKSMAGLWEFPGGKIDTGETPEQALIRELYEELQIEIAAEDLEILTFASHRYEKFHLLMPVFAVRHWQGDIQLKEGQGGMAWVAAKDLTDYPMPPADIPLIPILQKLIW